jgi:hypothetical protein
MTARTAIAIEAAKPDRPLAGWTRRAKARAVGIARKLFLRFSLYKALQKYLRKLGYARPYRRRV